MKKIQLSNGLRVILEPMPAYRSVSFGIWIKTGSRNEPGHLNGISHCVEHMLFKGTERFHAKAIAQHFDAIGGNVNAVTDKEYTCYYVKVLDQHVPTALHILSDMFLRPKMDEQDFIKERNVIIEEIAMYEDTPDDLVHDYIVQAAYGDHPIAYPVLGTEKQLYNMDVSDLHQFMKEHYTVQNTVLSIAGNIDDRIVEQLEQYFGCFHNEHVSTLLDKPLFKGKSLFYEKNTEQNHFCIAFPGISIGDLHQYAMLVLNHVIGGGMSSRLFQEVRENRGLAYAVYSYPTFFQDSGLFTLYAGCVPKQTVEVVDVILEVLHQFRQKGMTEKELVTAKEQLKGNIILGMESTNYRMHRFGKEELMLGHQQSLEHIITNIDQVSLEAIDTITSAMFSQPFCWSMVGEHDVANINTRRGDLIAHD